MSLIFIFLERSVHYTTRPKYEYGRSMFLQNVGIHLQYYIVSQSRRLQSKQILVAFSESDSKRLCKEPSMLVEILNIATEVTNGESIPTFPHMPSWNTAQ
jgi:hypothetical protein